MSEIICGHVIRKNKVDYLVASDKLDRNRARGRQRQLKLFFFYKFKKFTA